MDSHWKCALELNSSREVTLGSYRLLADAIARGADLRVYTEWNFDEHMIPYDSSLAGQNREGKVKEVIDFRQTMLMNGHHVAAVTTQRQPLCPTLGFNGTDAKMSFFLYNMTGHQSCANLELDSRKQFDGEIGVRTELPSPAGAEKMSVEECFDLRTCAPSRNFIYDMDVYRFIVRDDWRELYHHDGTGSPVAGRLDDLIAAFVSGQELKVGISHLCESPTSAEVFVSVGSAFFHTRRKTLDCGAHPLVRIQPAIPLKYESGNWDVVWTYLCTDGSASVRSLCPTTRQFSDSPARLACRWFGR